MTIYERIGDSYAARLFASAILGTARFAIKGLDSMVEYIGSPPSTMRNTRPDPDEMHKHLHYTYHNGIKS